MKTKHVSTVGVTLPAHRIVYTGLDPVRAKHTAALLRKAGCIVRRTKVRVLGSRLTDPNPWHYTVIVVG